MMEQELNTGRGELAWIITADQAIRTMAAKGPFTAEDVHTVVGDPPGSPNAMGGRFWALAMAGIIETVGYRRSGRPERRGGLQAIWLGARA